MEAEATGKGRDSSYESGWRRGKWGGRLTKGSKRSRKGGGRKLETGLFKVREDIRTSDREI